MPRKTIWLDQDLYDDVVDAHPADDSFSAIVRRALEEYHEQQLPDQSPK